ncbi:hypothetical protein RB623_10960 [Mesorhizobium sp. LHD-90]|uniref:hypothetical protein n=1 Tax=Mesorhizobium sp. LHD-90 TaxID=3071414 RepID=UPI0027E0677D|nr:hypothetical protein [Mesorhizobium sp. LHD-90]MDQ6434566.1 hypothetical protein [Mesorhizobium sp. LHD-90]
MTRFDAVKIQSVPYADLVARQTFELDRLDALARAMERKWGIGRLPLLVSEQLAEKFFRQFRKTNEALKSPDPRPAIEQIGRMITAWSVLDAEADRLGAPELRPCVIEAQMSDGTVIAIVRDKDEAGVVHHDGRAVQVYAASEIARLVEAWPEIVKVKETWPGATVQPARIDPNFWSKGDAIPF